MKKSLLLSTALVLGSLTLAQAGGMPEPVMSPEVVKAETSSASHDVLVPVMALILAVAVLSNGSSETVMVSDVRCKEDVSVVGMTPQGLPLVRWRYAGLPGLYEGVLAQDVARLRPEALVELPFGFKAVDYGRLGLRIRHVG